MTRTRRTRPVPHQASADCFATSYDVDFQLGPSLGLQHAQRLVVLSQRARAIQWSRHGKTASLSDALTHLCARVCPGRCWRIG